MKFGQNEIPQKLLDVAHAYASSLSSFGPDVIRQHLLDNLKSELNSVSTIESNHWIIANRVTRKIITDMSRKGALHRLEHGLWSKPKKSNASVVITATDVAALEAENADLLKCLRDIINACDRCGKADELSLIDEFSEEMEMAARDAIARADARRAAQP